MNAASRDEMIGRIYRSKATDRQRLAFINSELSGIAGLLKKASSQLECLLANERSELYSVLSQLNISGTLQLLAEREQLTHNIETADEELRRLRAPG
ncbi:MAG TPA: hypothetical protein VFA65_19025 [Bryobacteraceae bacterium]|nr:hypothetical protein [Bryobacteraceae bacterium]